MQLKRQRCKCAPNFNGRPFSNGKHEDAGQVATIFHFKEACRNRNAKNGVRFISGNMLYFPDASELGTAFYWHLWGPTATHGGGPALGSLESGLAD